MQTKYCAAPWRGLHINPRGDVKTCCAGDPNMLGNLNEHTIQDILCGDALREVRDSIRQGRLHAQYCYNCIKAERYGRSERDWHNSVNGDFDINTADDTQHIPSIVDVRWNTTCNLSCNYCGEQCSSRWAALKNVKFRSGTRPYSDEVCEYLRKHSGFIREVALVGGEPFLLPENEQLLGAVPLDATVTVITNATIDLTNNKIFDMLSRHPKVGWSLSFDNIGQRFEYVRHGASWSDLLRNIIKVQELMANRGHWGGIHAVYNVYNATRLKEFTEWARGQGLTIRWQSLYQPGYLDPMKLGPQMAQKCRDEIDSLLSSHLCLPDEAEFFCSVRDNFTMADSNYSADFAKHIQEIESRFHPESAGNFRRLWPELETLCISTL